MFGRESKRDRDHAARVDAALARQKQPAPVSPAKLPWTSPQAHQPKAKGRK